jgi:hypothetical protein
MQQFFGNFRAVQQVGMISASGFRAVPPEHEETVNSVTNGQCQWLLCDWSPAPHPNGQYGPIRILENHYRLDSICPTTGDKLLA